MGSMNRNSSSCKMGENKKVERKILWARICGEMKR
jgi:hypothetical protein